MNALLGSISSFELIDLVFGINSTAYFESLLEDSIVKAFLDFRPIPLSKFKRLLKFVYQYLAH